MNLVMTLQDLFGSRRIQSQDMIGQQIAKISLWYWFASELDSKGSTQHSTLDDAKVTRVLT